MGPNDHVGGEQYAGALRCLHVIYQEKYITFEHILKHANMKSLKIRRMELITIFSRKSFRHDKVKDWFSESEARTIGARTRCKPILG